MVLTWGTECAHAYAHTHGDKISIQSKYSLLSWLKAVTIKYYSGQDLHSLLYNKSFSWCAMRDTRLDSGTSSNSQPWFIPFKLHQYIDKKDSEQHLLQHFKKQVLTVPQKIMLLLFTGMYLMLPFSQRKDSRWQTTSKKYTFRKCILKLSGRFWY